MMYKHILFLLLPWFGTQCAYARDATLDSLLRLIDHGISNMQHYVDLRQERIALLRNRYAEAVSDESRYDIAFALYEEYKPFVNDSAIHYLNRCIALATRMEQPVKADVCRSWLALRCSNTGMYDEAQALLRGIDATGLQGTALGVYYFALAHVYGELAYYTRLADMRQVYEREAAHYRHLTFESLPQYDNNRMQMLELEFMNGSNHSRSKAVNDTWIGKVKKGSHPYALVAMYRYLEYKMVNDTTQMMRWLAESVLTDVHNAVMDQGSMWEMANQLLLMGQVDRAYKYISFTSDCAGHFGSRQRLSQISPLLANIAKQYKTESESKNKQVRRALGIISVMAFIILGTLFYVNRQRRRLAEARNKLARTNDMLSSLNAELSTLNNRLRKSNRHLADANRVKEEYVGRFMRLCSGYVDRLDDFRRRVSKLVKNRRYEDLDALANSSRYKDEELDELYANFDSAFLHLFPNFVDAFNAMLRPEERVVPADKLRLNTTVRIFALIRLGIDDSSKIAEFLHYSVNTIYNYRARVKNAAICDRDTFEDRVRNIGTDDMDGAAEGRVADSR